MSKTWKQITQELNEAKFKLPKDQEEVKRETHKVSGKPVNIVYGKDRRNKVHVYMDDVKIGTYRDIKAAEKEMKNIKNVMLTMGEENISKEEILGAIDEINI
tara:strand:+ start:77 stop:382 length:306 start_codon:yes stop_codon:yes gene_type:complete